MPGSRSVDLALRETPREADTAAVAGLVAATGFFNAAEREVAVELVRERLDRGEGSGYFFLFAERREGLLGYACWGPIPGTAGSWDLYWIAVSPDRQRDGIGSLLLGEVERRVAGEGGRRLWVDTAGRPQYLPTRAFYRRCGYREAARLRDFYSAGDDKVILVKALAP